MTESEITLKLPRSLVLNLGYKEEEVEKALKQILAVELYREGKISLGKATELTGYKNKWNMILLLNQHGISLNYDAADLKDDAETLKKLGL